MGKLEKKINLIKDYLPRCNSVYSCYTYGSIPRAKFNNACLSYAGHVEYDKALGLIDETVFGSGKKGMLFTEVGLYASGITHIMKYSDGPSFTSLPDSYNLTEINELLDKLSDIENALTGWDIAGSLLGAVFDGVVSAITEPTSNSETGEAEDDDVNIIDVNDVSEVQGISTTKDDSFGEQVEIAHSWLEMIESMISDTLVCDKDNFLVNMENILQELDSESSYNIEEFIDQSIGDMRTGSQDADGILFTKRSKKTVNKIKYYISALKDADDGEEISSEITEAKKALRNYINTLNNVEDSLEEISK